MQVHQAAPHARPWPQRRMICAAVGDVRLVDEATVAQWRTGRLEVFLEGSWSQVCGGGFGGADAAVACRQLGFGGGTLAVTPRRDAAPRQVYPEAGLAFPECVGDEERLVDCPRPMTHTGLPLEAADCFGSDRPGLRLACVAQPVTGTVHR